MNWNEILCKTGKILYWKIWNVTNSISGWGFKPVSNIMNGTDGQTSTDEDPR